jgi:hypothetical protein
MQQQIGRKAIFRGDHSTGHRRDSLLLKPHVIITAIAAAILAFVYLVRPERPTSCTTDFVRWWPAPEDTDRPLSAYCK